MAQPLKKTNNPVIQRIAADGVLAPGQAGSGVANAMNSTFANLRGGAAGIAGPSIEEQNTVANAPRDATPLPLGKEGMSIATGNLLGAGLPRAGAPSLASVGSAPEQVAGVVAGLDDQKKVQDFQQRLMDAGITPDNMATNRVAVQGIYNTVFGAGLPPGATGGPTQAFAPTGLRDRVMAANGGLVFGQGNVMAGLDSPAQVETPGMSQYQKDRLHGNRFFLGQVTPMSANGAAPAPPPNPILGQPTSAMGAQSQTPQTPFQRNAEAFKNHQVTQQMQAGLLKALPPGYMLDPDKPNAIKPIPGGPAETKIADAAKATQEKASQVAETSNNVIGTIDEILPKINWNTVGPIGSLKSHIAGTDAYDLAKLRDTVTSNIGITQLQQMRDASKTGSSGFGQLSEKELDVLQSSIASLDQAQKPEQFKEALTKVRNHFTAWKTSYEAGQKANSGSLSPQDQARAILAIRKAGGGK